MPAAGARAKASARNGGGNKGGGRALQQAPPQAQSRQLLSLIKASMKQMMAAQLKSIPRGPVGGHDNQAMFRAALRSAQFAPRGHGYYDAFGNKCENVLLGAAVGPATCIHGASLTTIPSTPRVTGSYTYTAGSNTNTGILTTNKKLVIFNPGSSDSVLGIVISFVHPMQTGQTDPTVLDTTKVACQISEIISAQQFSDLGPALQHSTYAFDHLDGMPNTDSIDPSDRIESIPLRGSLRIKNVSENIAVGGSVRVLRYNGSVRYWKDQSGVAVSDVANGSSNFSTPDVQMVLQLCDMIESSERTKHYGGKELLVKHQINTHPADFIRSSTFEYDKHFDESIHNTRYNTVLILIDDFASSSGSLSNTYELSCQVHRAARFAPGSVLHAKAQEVKADPAMAAKLAALESQMGSMLSKGGGAAKAYELGGGLRGPPPGAP